MKTLLALFIMGSEVRQFLHSGLFARLLEAGWRIIVMAKVFDDDLLAQLPPQVQVVPLLPQSNALLGTTLTRILDQAFLDYRARLGESAWQYGKTSLRNWKEKSLFGMARGAGFLLSFLPGLIHKGHRLERLLYRNTKATQHWLDFLTANRVDAVLVNVPRQTIWNPLFAAAERLGIRTFLAYHTAKDVIANGRLNHAFSAIGVWGAEMRQSLLARNPWLDAGRVQVIGCGHFDCVGRPDWLPDEGEFRCGIGALPDSILVLYPTAGPGIVPAEERYIAYVVEAARRLEPVLGRKIQLVFRLNPMDNRPTLRDHLRQTYPEHLILRPDWQDIRERNWCYARKSDPLLYNALLFFSSLCVTIPSTVTLDCAFADLPVINLGIETPGPQPLAGSLRAFWEVGFNRSVRETQSARFVTTQAELESAMRAYLQDKSLDAENRRHLLQREVDGIAPGQSSLLLAELLQAQGNKSPA